MREIDQLAEPRLGATDRPDWSTDLVAAGLLLFGVQLVGLSALMFVSPATFFNEIAPFGVRNDHYLLDGATFQMALGVGALAAASRPRWRVPVLAILTFQFSLHAFNHGLDIGEADPAWLGVANFVALAAGALLLIWLLPRALRAEGESR